MSSQNSTKTSSSCSNPAKANPTDWFHNKFGTAVQLVDRRRSENRLNQRIKKYSDVKKKLEESLAIRRHQELGRRYSFFNADNEIFEEPGEEQNEDELGSESGDDNEDATVEAEGRKGADGEAIKEDLEETAYEKAVGELSDADGEDEIDEEEEISDKEYEGEGERSTDVEQEVDEGSLSEEQQVNEEGGKKPPNFLKTPINSDDEDEGVPVNNNNTSKLTKRRIIDEEEEDNEESLERRSPTNGDEKHVVFGESEKDEIAHVVPEETGKLRNNEFFHKSRSENIGNDELFTVDDEVEDYGAETEFVENRIIGSSDKFFERKYADDDDEFDAGEKSKRKIHELLDDEASLSGDDIGSDLDEEQGDGLLDQYEEEEGDKDELPNDEEIRDNLVRQYMKHQKDAGDRQLLKLQEAFFADADLHGQGTSADRSFRFRMYGDEKIDWAKYGMAAGHGEEDGDNEEEGEVEWEERRLAMIKWQQKQRGEEGRKRKRTDDDQADGDGEEHDSQEAPSAGEDLGTFESPLFALGGQIVWAGEKENMAASTSSCQQNCTNGAVPTAKRRNSLLDRAIHLGNLLKDGGKKTAPQNSNVPAFFISDK